MGNTLTFYIICYQIRKANLLMFIVYTWKSENPINVGLLRIHIYI